MNTHAEYIVAASRLDQEENRKIRLCPSGRYVNPFTMTGDDVEIEDVAHHLSLLCRYTGGSPYHYSVAQHSVLASYAGALRPPPRGVRKAAWIMAHHLHDSGEYVFNDIASPVKKDPRMAFYCEAEHNLTRMILAKFGVDPALLEATKPVDDELFRLETTTWWGAYGSVERWTPEGAERRFLACFYDLRRRM